MFSSGDCCGFLSQREFSNGLMVRALIVRPQERHTGMDTVLVTLYAYLMRKHSPATLKKKSESHSVMSDSLRPQGLYSPWNSPGQNTGVDNLSLLQGIYPTQGSNPGLSHCRQILCQLSYKGIPRILAW